MINWFREFGAISDYTVQLYVRLRCLLLSIGSLVETCSSLHCKRLLALKQWGYSKPSISPIAKANHGITKYHEPCIDRALGFQMICLLLVAGFMATTSQHTHSFVASEQGDLIMTGGTSVTRNPLECLRSGSPEQHSIATFVLPLTHGVTLTRVSFAYRYTVGWGAPSPGNGTNFSLIVAKSNLYTSPQYNDYPYSKSRPNYSMPVVVDRSVLAAVPTIGTTRLELHFDNHDRNIQVYACTCV